MRFMDSSGGSRRPGARRPRRGRGSELFQETEIVLEEETDLGNAVTKQRNALEPHAEREAGGFFGVVADRAEHVGVHHPGPQHLDPARALAERTAGLALLGLLFSGAAA